MASQTKYATVTSEIAGSGQPWSAAALSPCKVTADDNTYAASSALELDQSTRALLCTGFGFTLPKSATNFRVTVFALCKASASGALSLVEAACWYAGAQKSTVNPATPPIAVTDSETDLLSGMEAWSMPLSVDNINDSTFGVSLQFQATDAPGTAYVEQVGLTVEYDILCEARTAMFHDLYDGGDTGLRNWTIIGANILYAADTKYASVGLDSGQTSEYLEGRSFGFSSAIASDMTILGVKLELRLRVYGETGVVDSAIRLRSATGTYIGDDKKSAVEYDNLSEYVTRTYGSDSDTWGLDTTELTPLLVRDYRFGVGLAYTRTSGTGTATVTVDKATLTIYFGMQPDEPAYSTSHGGGRHHRTRRGVWGKQYKR